VFDRNGKFLFKFGSKGQKNGQFDCPYGVTVDQRNNQIVVVDTDNHCIQIFDEKGTFLRVFGSNGQGDGQFSSPRGVVVDEQGNYVVTEYSNHRVEIFNSQGQFVRKFGSEGAGNGQLKYPFGMGLLSNGKEKKRKEKKKMMYFSFVLFCSVPIFPRGSFSFLLLPSFSIHTTAPSLSLVLAIVLAAVIVVQSECGSSSVSLCEVIGQPSSSSTSSSAMSSFVPVPADSDFPIQNLPFGVFSTQNKVKRPQREERKKED